MITLQTNNPHERVKKIVMGAAAAALYALLTLAIAPISSGLMQLRLSEGLCVLPYFLPDAAWGLFIGCAIANLLTGAMWFDILFGSIATLTAALITAYLGKRGASKWLAPLPAVIINAFIVGAVLCFGYRVGVDYPLCILYIAAGQGISCYAVGMPIMAAVAPLKKWLFGGQK